MVTMSAFTVLFLVIVVGFWTKKIKSVGALLLGTLFGLSAAATAFGPPVLLAFQTFLTWLVGLIGQFAV